VSGEGGGVAVPGVTGSLVWDLSKSAGRERMVGGTVVVIFCSLNWRSENGNLILHADCDMFCGTSG
jgi:hypothetical protein